MVEQKKRSTYDAALTSEKLGISLEEAKRIVADRKQRSGGSLENFIKRHGEELGKIKFDEFRNKSKITKEKFQLKFGDEWEEKWLTYLETKILGHWQH